MWEASRELHKAMDHVGMAPRPPPHLRRPARLAPVSWLTSQQPILAAQISPLVTISARNPLLPKGLPNETSSITPYSPEPPKKAVPTPTPMLPINPGQDAPTATPLNVTSSTDGPRRRQEAPPIPDHDVPLARPSTSSGPLSFLSSGGQFRFTAAGEARFKLLAAEGKYDEAFGMLPEDQHFEHLTTPGAISAFRLAHPRSERGKGNAVETELWVCRAKVKIERKELPKVAKIDATEYEFDVVYSDEPCNGAASTHCNMVRHKKRTHLGRLYQCGATQRR